MKRLSLLLIMIALVASVLVQCKKESETKEIQLTTYTTEDGLANNSVNSIAIDTQGIIWFGTDAGISKYNETSWTNYITTDIYSNHINAIVIDALGNKWFGTGWGVLEFDGTTWTSYTTSDGLYYNEITAIECDREGVLWVGTNSIPGGFLTDTQPGGVSKFDGETWISYVPETIPYLGVQCMAISKTGTIWLGYGSGVFELSGTTWTHYTTSEGLICDVVSAVAIDNDGNKWFGTFGGVSKFDGTNWTTYTTSDGLAGNVVTAIAIDADGNKWFGTGNYNEQGGADGTGVSKFDGTTWTTYTTANGLVSNNIKAIAIDTEGNKWFGTDSGISKLSDVSR